jgi:hypothetical protein
MTAPKATTIQQKFGFADKDLTTPKHDEIMLWLDANIIQVMAPKVSRHTWSKDSIAGWRTRADQAMANDKDWTGLGPIPDYPDLTITKRWEYPITTGQGNKFIVGFIDMLATIPEPRLSVSDITKRSRDGIWYRDSAISLPKWEVYSPSISACFEVKSSIPSLGEVIRQIRMYQQYLENVMFYVVSPDDHFADAIRAQNIGFIKYEP